MDAPGADGFVVEVDPGEFVVAGAFVVVVDGRGNVLVLTVAGTVVDDVVEVVRVVGVGTTTGTTTARGEAGRTSRNKANVATKTMPKTVVDRLT